MQFILQDEIQHPAKFKAFIYNVWVVYSQYKFKFFGLNLLLGGKLRGKCGNYTVKILHR